MQSPMWGVPYTLWRLRAARGLPFTRNLSGSWMAAMNFNEFHYRSASFPPWLPSVTNPPANAPDTHSGLYPTHPPSCINSRGKQ